MVEYLHVGIHRFYVAMQLLAHGTKRKPLVVALYAACPVDEIAVRLNESIGTMLCHSQLAVC
jgi:hypothetical protein